MSRDNIIPFESEEVPNSEIIRISKSELEGIALAAARVAVQECQTSFMATLGVNINNIDDIKDFQATLRFADNLRAGSAKVGARLGMTSLTIVAGAVSIAGWEWFKDLLHTLK